MERCDTKPIPIDRAAVMLIRRFGDDCAIMAWQRAKTCMALGEHRAAAEWQLVLRRLLNVYFVHRPDILH